MPDILVTVQDVLVTAQPTSQIICICSHIVSGLKQKPANGQIVYPGQIKFLKTKRGQLRIEYKGPSINYVRIVTCFLDPLPPFLHVIRNRNV